MFLTFLQKSRVFYSTNEMAEGVVKDNQMSSGDLPQACPPRHGAPIVTSAVGQWCCEGNQSFGNGLNPTTLLS